MVSWYIRAVQTVISIRFGVRPPPLEYKMFYPERKEYMHRLVYESDDTCLHQLRMNRATFVTLCNMLENTGNLKASKYLQVDEQVAIFLYVLAHHVKNRVAKFLFRRSGDTISKHFNNVLNSVIRLQNELFKKPESISETSTDERWKWFKGCLGAIDGTHISVQVPEEDKPRYCWEGSAADGRILRSAMIRENGLQVPKGNYYLVDAGEMAYDPLDDEEFIDTNNDADDEDLGSHVDLARGPGKNKRKWNNIEDEKLVAAMLDVLNSGSNYKSDNGFKPGFYNAVEQQLAKALPEAGIKAKPHIESRIKTMKSDWSAVHDMLAWNNTSGFGWDHNNDMLDAPQPVHKNASQWRGKKFPHYWDLCNVFGKDRANGRDAQTAVDILSDINREEQEPIGDGLDDIDVDQPLNNPSYVASREEPSTQRKRRRRNSLDPLMNSLKESAGIIGAEIREATNTFNRVFGTESNREEMRNNLFAEMNKVEGLTLRECDKAVCKLAQNEELMVIFFKVDEDRKLGWVKNMLDDIA
ncbi:hypothetical protein QVD17_12570 [Tagetes erecta]|uniref:Myb/SANT-like domain-containing protein n=1 Tax=Tagetes erecta TaxID=13708 RepID=A0AAD8KWS0_TARER|nr:hypothetical protein QVD17_12570 [Tagetes erecta]